LTRRPLDIFSRTRFGAGWNRALDRVLGNWQLTGILNLRGGFPLTESKRLESSALNFSTSPTRSSATRRVQIC
jgi:hypothetical protein